MCSQSKGIGSADISASTYDKIRTIPARLHCASHRRDNAQAHRRGRKLEASSSRRNASVPRVLCSLWFGLRPGKKCNETLPRFKLVVDGKNAAPGRSRYRIPHVSCAHGRVVLSVPEHLDGLSKGNAIGPTVERLDHTFDDARRGRTDAIDLREANTRAENAIGMFAFPKHGSPAQAEVDGSEQCKEDQCGDQNGDH